MPTREQYGSRFRRVALACLFAATVAASVAVASPAYATDTTPPSAPSNLHTSATTVSTITLAWTAATDNVGIGHYNVYRDGTKVATPGSTSYTDSGLWPHSTHTYYVSASDTSGNEGGSTSVITAFTNADTTAPTAPTGLTPTFHKSPLSVSLVWNASTDDVKVDHYDVYRDLVKIASTTNTNYNDTTVSANKTVKYLVQAVDEVSNSSNSSNQVQLNTDIQAPTTPTNLHITSATSNAISLAWTASTDNYAVTSYDIIRNGVKIANQSYAVGTTYYNAGLPSGTTYTYEVAARDANDNVSTSSNTATATTTGGGDSQAPSAPTNLTAQVSDGNVNLSWGPSTDNVGVTGYLVIRNGTTVATVNGTTWIDTSPPTNVNDGYTIEAKDAAGNVSDASNTASVYIDTQPPTPPSNLTARGAQTSVSLSWSAATDNVRVDKYRIKRNGIVLATTSSTSFSDTKKPDGPEMSYTVTAVDTSGNTSQPSNEASIPAPATTEWMGGYLSDMTPTSSSNGSGPIQYDKSNGGHTIKLGGTAFTKGLGTWAPSDIVFDTAGKCSTFTAKVGVDDEVGNGGSVDFSVYADGVKLFDSGTMTGTSTTKNINVGISGKQSLELKVVHVGAGSTSDSADWAMARIKCTTFLTDAGPDSFSNGQGPIRYNVSNGGNKLTLAGKTYSRGIGTYAPSDIAYDVNGQCTNFSASIGVDDEVGNGGSVDFLVYTDGVKVYESGTMTGASATKTVSVSITGATQLELKVVHVGANATADSADWAAAKVTCN